MTLTKKKFRYIAIFFPNKPALEPGKFFDEFSGRFIEVFGAMEYFNSLSRLIKSKESVDNVFILKCNLDSLSSTLISLYLLNQEIITVSISGTLKQVKKKSHLFRKSFFESQTSIKNPSFEHV
ncbi:Rpp14/Pop5 family protein [Candidatus Nitrosocosmicus hydrocola]|uniref:Rpp14/Pop5 family protein n=1 Tax=Candidatus Nitrosocosmicus hydrocola TaxID=1826872 RepID=UPI0011E5A464|nr:Rpp14/Pop5 family protein [Candidatus Nitrosocosmicus hydrocola]